MDRGTVVVIALCLVLVAWYAVGYLYNLRRGRRLFAWLETGLGVLGGERTAGWMGSAASGARIQILHADAPFRRLEVTLLLARREIPLLWLLDHLRGRRDRLIIKATLRSPRQGELEVTPPRKSFLESAAADYRRDPSWAGEVGPHGLLVLHRGPSTERQQASLRPWLQAYGHALRRLAWQKSDPHIQVHLDLVKWATTSSQEMLDGLRIAVSVPHMNK
jgi:hypothetical protein